MPWKRAAPVSQSDRSDNLLFVMEQAGQKNAVSKLTTRNDLTYGRAVLDEKPQVRPRFREVTEVEVEASRWQWAR